MNTANDTLLNKLYSVASTPYDFNNYEILDPLTKIRHDPELDDEARISTITNWIATEFHLPGVFRELCDAAFLRVLTNSQFFSMTGELDDAPQEEASNEILMGERSYSLYCQSNPRVLRYAPLISVSFRIFNGQHYAIAHVWAARQASGKGF